MLKGIDPLLGPDLLRVLREMGHGDVLALVDRNYPAAASGRPVLRLDGVDTTRAAAAILSVLPVDDFVTPAVWRMEVVDDPEEIPEVQQAFTQEVARHTSDVEVAGLERFEFYRRAAEAYAVVATGETRPYGCFLLTKGVV